VSWAKWTSWMRAIAIRGVYLCARLRRHGRLTASSPWLRLFPRRRLPSFKRFLCSATRIPAGNLERSQSDISAFSVDDTKSRSGSPRSPSVFPTLGMTLSVVPLWRSNQAILWSRVARLQAASREAYHLTLERCQVAAAQWSAFIHHVSQHFEFCAWLTAEAVAISASTKTRLHDHSEHFPANERRSLTRSAKGSHHPGKRSQALHRAISDQGWLAEAFVWSSSQYPTRVHH